MAKETGDKIREASRKSQRTPPKTKYDRVVLADIRRSRRGKHRDLVEGIFHDLESLPSDSAIKIRLQDLDGTTLANLRSALHRESASRRCGIETLSDEENFYVWKAPE
jgi:hypothetical protein